MKNGWVSKRLEDIGKTQTGSTPKTSEKKYFGDSIPFVKPADFAADGSLNYGNDGLSVLGLKKSRRVPAGSVLMVCIGATIGKCGYCDLDVTTNQQINSLTPRDGVLHKFVYYQMLTADFQRRVMLSSAQATLPIISKSKWSQLTVTLPSLPEQRRIVGFLDEAFDGIATAKANAEKNLQNARALFESHLQSVFSQRGEGWANKPLVTLCTLFVDCAHRTPKYQAEGIPALRPRDVVNGNLVLSGAARVSQEEYEIQSKRHKPTGGDIVYSRELSYGWGAILPESPRVCLSQGMCVFRPSAGLDSAFLLYVLNGSVAREQAVRAAVGTAHPHINLCDIKSYQIPLPPLDEQIRVTQKLDFLRDETQRLSSLYQRKLAALEALKKSLLHQAFSGEL